MREQFGRAGRMGAGPPELADTADDANRLHYDGARILDQFETDLPASVKLHIDLGEQLGIEQRTMLRAVAAIYAIASAERIERKLRTRMADLGERNGIDHPRQADTFKPAKRQFSIEKTEVETRVVRDQRAVGDEFEQLGSPFGKSWLVSQKGIRKSMHGFRFRGHRSFGIEIGVESASRRHAVHHFDATYLHHPVSARGIQAGRLGVENDLTHH